MRDDREAVLIIGEFGSGKVSGRHRDSGRARASRGTTLGRTGNASIEDATVSNDRPIREVAMEVLDWLGWL